MGMSQQEVANLCFSTPEMLRQWKYHISHGGMGNIAENIGPCVSVQKTGICHLERLDPKTLSLGRSVQLRVRLLEDYGDLELKSEL